ncbi:MAG: hypothetical protein RLY40_966 [Pseudomonadota bacterium]|jgi:ABC-type uncharacterized transport system fused permease/ATPase subunit
MKTGSNIIYFIWDSPLAIERLFYCSARTLGQLSIPIPGYLFWTACLFGVLGIWLTNRVGRKLISYNYHQQRYNANFRCEQQLMALIRVVLNKPDILFLDEATSSLDDAAQMHAYQNLRLLLPQSCLISIGHRADLTQFHSKLIIFSKNKSVSLTAISIQGKQVAEPLTVSD